MLVWTLRCKPCTTFRTRLWLFLRNLFSSFSARKSIRRLPVLCPRYEVFHVFGALVWVLGNYLFYLNEVLREILQDFAVLLAFMLPIFIKSHTFLCGPYRFWCLQIPNFIKSYKILYGAYDFWYLQIPICIKSYMVHIDFDTSRYRFL